MLQYISIEVCVYLRARLQKCRYQNFQHVQTPVLKGILNTFEKANFCFGMSRLVSLEIFLASWIRSD